MNTSTRITGKLSIMAEKGKQEAFGVA